MLLIFSSIVLIHYIIWRLRFVESICIRSSSTFTASLSLLVTVIVIRKRVYYLLISFALNLLSLWVVSSQICCCKWALILFFFSVNWFISLFAQTIAHWFHFMRTQSSLILYQSSFYFVLDRVKVPTSLFFETSNLVGNHLFL